jgi:hypothetical protein
MSFCRFDAVVETSASTAWMRSLAWALVAQLAGSVARAEPPPQVAASETDSGATLAALPSLEQASDPSSYQGVKALAVEEWNAGRWAEARALFLLAHSLKPSARTLRALGKTAFELRLYPEAVRELSAALSDLRQPLDPAMRSEVRSLLQRAESFVGRYHIQLQPPDAHLRVDGGTPVLEADGSVLLALGHHQLEIEASGYLTEHHEIVVADGAGKTLSFRLSPEARPLPSRPSRSPDQGGLHYHAWSLSTAAGAVVLGTTSLGLFLRARSLDVRLERDCNADCNPDDDRTHKRDALVRASYGMLGGAALFATGSLVAFLIERGQRGERRRFARAPEGALRPRAARAHPRLVLDRADLALHF